jgi:hypothetical protein
MPFADKEKQLSYMREYQFLKRKILSNSNQVVRKCQHCQVLTIQEKCDEDYKCLKCESLT